MRYRSHSIRVSTNNRKVSMLLQDSNQYQAYVNKKNVSSDSLKVWIFLDKPSNCEMFKDCVVWG